MITKDFFAEINKYITMFCFLEVLKVEMRVKYIPILIKFVEKLPLLKHFYIIFLYLLCTCVFDENIKPLYQAIPNVTTF